MTYTLKETGNDFPFDWANLNDYRESLSYRREIYLKEQNEVVDELAFLFFSLFGSFKDGIIVYNKSWWDFCLDTWDFNKDEYDYSVEGKSFETQEYLKMLIENQIQPDYSGCCICFNWDKFLLVTLRCIVSHTAPYSPLFCDVQNNYFFYFHHTGSIGIYYKEENHTIEQILKSAHKHYIVTE